MSIESQRRLIVFSVILLVLIIILYILFGVFFPNPPAGPPGPNGPKGDTGQQGFQGPNGLKGDTGGTGATGATGPRGPSGINGRDFGFQYVGVVDDAFFGPGGIPASGCFNNGSTGGFFVFVTSDNRANKSLPVGLPSNVTNHALVLNCATGVWTDVGILTVGPTGQQGNSGNTGPQGATGIPAAQGATGPTGPTGVTGTTGPQGIVGKGVQGDTGVKGDTGSKGDTGTQGIPGTATNTGATGPTGPTGTVGVDESDFTTGFTFVPGGATTASTLKVRKFGNIVMIHSVGNTSSTLSGNNGVIVSSTPLPVADRPPAGFTATGPVPTIDTGTPQTTFGRIVIQDTGTMLFYVNASTSSSFTGGATTTTGVLGGWTITYGTTV